MSFTYTQENGYRIPNLALPDTPTHKLGKWGQRRFAYLKAHKRIMFTHLHTSGALYEHIHEIDRTATTRHEQIVARMMQAQGVAEQLKAENQMMWLGKVNNICHQADEIIFRELIYT